VPQWSRILFSVAAFALLASSAAATPTSGRGPLPTTRDRHSAGFGLAAPKAARRSRVAFSALESGLLARVNSVRRSHGLRALKPSKALSAAASRHTRQMLREGVFQHDSREAFWKRIERFYDSSGYSSWEVGENLAQGSPELDAVATVRMWLASPSHRVNLLSHSWREVGLGAVHVASAGGAFGNAPVTVVTADFGTRVR
jgi:uncharacterized protein YkwD